MKIFYYCFSGVHTSLIAAAIHLEKFSLSSKPAYRDIIKNDKYNNLKWTELGTPIYLGKDNYGNEIFTFGVMNEKKLILKAVQNLLNLYKIDDNEYLLVDTTLFENWLIRFGIRLSSGLTMKRMGGYLAFLGILRNYERLAQEVLKVKKTVAGDKKKEIKFEATKMLISNSNYL